MPTSFTSESVCAGHPDKICDQISDAILDDILEQDPEGRVAVEAAVTANRVVLLGEVTTSANIDYENIVRNLVKRLGYTEPAWDFDAESLEVNNYIRKQSPEIAAGVDLDGAGDQGMMFGYACRETAQLMPLPITLAHGLTQRIDEARQSKELPYLRPDGKTQVTVIYEGGKPAGITHVTVAVPHHNEVQLKEVRDAVIEKVIAPVLSSYGFSASEKQVVVNGTGVWHSPGPAVDAGLTGRKIVVDGYGGYARVGGGAFSGKDPTKVDRSGAYAARYLAKNVVAAGLADQCEIALAYFIGAKQPIMIDINTFDTAHESIKQIQDLVAELIEPNVSGIIQGLNLRQPVYLKTAAYGHFGRPELPWEEVKP